MSLEKEKNNKIYFLRRGQIDSPNYNLDFIPTTVIREFNLIDPQVPVSINTDLTNELITEREKTINFSKVDTIFTAESYRSQKTAKTVREYIESNHNKTPEVIPTFLLNEIIYRIEKIFPEFIAEHQKIHPRVIEYQIMKAMVDSEWCEPVKQLFWRIEYLLEILNKKDTKGDICVITHRFLLRAIELYLRFKDKDLMDFSNLLTTQFNHPLHGFITDKEGSYFKALPVPSYVLTSEYLEKETLQSSRYTGKAKIEKTSIQKEPDTYFIRHSKVSLPFNGHGHMPSGVIRDLVSNVLDPKIDKWLTEDLIHERASDMDLSQVGVIFTAQSSRSQTTAEAIRDYIYQNFNKKVDVHTFHYLNEVQFNFEKVYPKTPGEFETVDINLLNEAVLKAMVLGENCESLRQCYSKIEYFFKLIQMHKTKGKVLAITHDYLMRAIELYIKSRHFSLATFDDILSTQRNGYLDGFATDYKHSFFKPLSHINKMF